MNAPLRLYVRAGGRREVLRRLPMALVRCHPGCGTHTTLPSTFVWDHDQPTLVLDIPDTTTGTSADMWIVMAEEMLDRLMHQYPWQEQPLLDWTGPRSAPRLSVTAGERSPEAGMPKAAGLSPAVMEGVQLLSAESGDIVKEVWILILQTIYSIFRGLRVPRALLLEQIPEPLRAPVEEKLRRTLAKQIEVQRDPHRLLPALHVSLMAHEPLKQAEMLEQVALALGFRLDEHAYLMLLAGTIGTSGTRAFA